MTNTIIPIYELILLSQDLALLINLMVLFLLLHFFMRKLPCISVDLSSSRIYLDIEVLLVFLLLYFHFLLQNEFL